MQRVYLLAIPAIFSLIFNASFAAEPQTPTSAPSVAATQTPVVKQDYCPAVNELQKKDLFWGAPGGWISYGESWDPKVVRFVKAQWIGINVGKIICIYSSDRKNSFPIALEQKQNRIVYNPTGVNWSKDLQGHKECHPLSGDVKDCPFLFEAPQENGDVYKDLDFFKGKEHRDDY